MTITIVSWWATLSQTPSFTSTKELQSWMSLCRSWRKFTNPRAGHQEVLMCCKDLCCCCAALVPNTLSGYRWPGRNSAERSVGESPCWTINHSSPLAGWIRLNYTNPGGGQPNGPRYSNTAMEFISTIPPLSQPSPRVAPMSSESPSSTEPVSQPISCWL